jgi:hypothetical protein
MGLVDKRGEMKRPHGRKSTSSVGLALGGLDCDKISPWQNGDGPNFKPRLQLRGEDGRTAPVQVDMARLYAQFDFLARIAANPLAKAKVWLSISPVPKNGSSCRRTGRVVLRGVGGQRSVRRLTPCGPVSRPKIEIGRHHCRHRAHAGL